MIVGFVDSVGVVDGGRVVVVGGGVGVGVRHSIVELILESTLS